ncbi:MAG: TlpA family protein disulfide reductase, partial [Gammaproteobacteria bacterium]|nr:TlpA family protein disulfide reductase [Gammaproteobacteria bacterium]
GETGKPRPEFSLNDLTGTPRRVREWDGRLLFVNFWATWCPPCLREIPTFIELQERYGSRGLQFLGVAIQDPVPVMEFVREAGINYPVLVGQEDAMQVAKEYGNRFGGLPFTAVVDRNGTILYARGGELSMEQAEKLIKINL